jgi:hypothetical protein
MLPFPVNSMINNIPQSVTGAALGIAGVLLYLHINPARPDPFTGTNAKEMEQRLMLAVGRIESRLDEHLNYSLAKTALYDKELGRLSALCARQRPPEM